MAPDMVDRDQGLAHGHGRSLGKIHTHQHGADEAGGIGHRHGIDIIPGQLCPFQRLIRQTVDGFNVLSGGDLRHDTAVDPVQIHLGGDAVTEHFPSVTDDGHGGFIT